MNNIQEVINDLSTKWLIRPTILKGYTTKIPGKQIIISMVGILSQESYSWREEAQEILPF
jgi:hypothetical protein